MPGPITHLKSAYFFAEMLDIKDRPMLYLGAICPDSVNVYGHAPKELRWPAHLRDSNLNIWLNNAKEFYDQNNVKIHREYLLGYILHIVTDIVWDMYFDKLLFKALKTQIVDADNFKDTRWQELYGYEQEQLKCNWAKEMINDLSLSKPLEIGTLKLKEIEKMKQSVINNDISKGRKPSVLDDNFMRSFYIKVVETMQNTIKIK